MFKLTLCRTLLQFLILTGLVCLLTSHAKAQQIRQAELLQKLAPGIPQSPEKSSPLTVRVQVKNKASFLRWMKEQQVQTAIQEIAGMDHLVVISKLDARSLQKLLQNPWTEYVDKPNRVAREELELRDADFTVNKVLTLQSKYPQLNGQGFAVSVKEGAFNPEDIDLKGRVITPEKNGSSYSIHATTMATLIAGAGNSGPNGKGVAPKARLAYSDFANLLPDNSAELLNKGISVQNHSYGVGVENYYGIESAAYDKQTFEYPQLLHIFSSGNSGDKTDNNGNYANTPGMANLTGQFKTSKNTLSVGALDPDGKVGQLSSKGPAYDGRVKPELVAHGTGGTSEAAAVVAGIALLVQQAYLSQHGGMLPPAALVKAALINSADDVGRPAVDFESGYGNADALGAIRAIKENTFFTGTINNAEEKKFTIQVPEGAARLKVTLVWHEKEASPAAQAALINDLDLKLRHVPSTAIWQPWVLNSYPHPDSLKLPAKRGTDRLNNIEQISVAAPAAGVYELLVNGFQVPQGTQDFSLVYEFESTSEWIYPAANTALLANQPYSISWQTTQQTGTATLEYKYVGDLNWKLLADNIDLTTNKYKWQTPDTAALLQLRLINNNITIESEEFIISRYLKLKVGFVCEDRLMVHWTGMPHLRNYQLFQMGDTELQPLLTTTDTLAILNRSTIQNLNNLFAVAPVIQNKLGQSSNTLAADQTGVACYIRSFLPKHFVLDQISLQLEISTLYDLASISLERENGFTFKEVSSLVPDQLSYELTDPAPAPGKNKYRVKLTTKSGIVYYSQTEEVIHASATYVQAYPNPVEIGESLYIVVASPSATLQLFDRLGKLMYEATEDSVIKSIPTDNLPAGLYILRVLTADGKYLSTKVILI